MYYGKKKKIIIISSIVVGVLAIAGIFLFMFLGTDMFKSNKTLFWKYAMDIPVDTTSLSTTQLDDVEKMKIQKPYTVEGELSIASNSNGNTVDLGKININGETDKAEDYSHYKLNYIYNSENFLNAEYVSTYVENGQNKDKVYALKSDEIVTAFLGVRNDNLNVLTQKLGIPSDVVPSEIESNSINFLDLFKFTDTELQHIYETYSEIILNNIPDSNYSKNTDAVIEVGGKNYKTTSLRVDLSSEELKKVLLSVLNTAKTDSLMLNLISTKLKTVGMNAEDSSIDSIKLYIENIIDTIENNEVKDTSFVIYVHDGKNIATEVIIKNDSKYTICNGQNKLEIKYDDLIGDLGHIEVSISYNFTSTLSSITAVATKDKEEILSLNITNTGSATQGNLSTSITLDINNVASFEYSQSLDFADKIENKVKLDQSNCVILNDYSKDNLQNLLSLVGGRIGQVFNEKYAIISAKIQSGTATNVSSQVIESYNSRFEAYKGTITGAQLKTLKLMVESNNESADTDNTVTMYLDNVKVTEDTSINSNSNYNVEVEKSNNGFVNTIKVTTV